MSDRKEAVERIALFIRDNKLTRPYGGDVNQDKTVKGSPWTVGFAIPKYLDGYVVVYSPKWIMVDFETTYRPLPHRGKLVFESIDRAIEFIDLAFVKLEGERAMCVPTKAKQSGVKGDRETGR